MPAQSLPAPVGGINLRKSRAELPLDAALVLDNWIPDHGYVRSRGGYIEHCFLGNPVETLAYYNAGDGSPQVIAAAGGVLYDATSASASVLATGFSEDRWQTVNANGRLLLINGTDSPQEYDGSTMADISPLSGPADTAKLVGAMVFKGRVFYFEKNSQSFWYAGAGAYKGTLSEFSMDFVTQRGGALVQMFSVTADAGNGEDDFAVFVFDSGEALIYQGNDPSSTSAWSLVGRYNVGEPIGYNGNERFGPDQFLITRNGYCNMRRLIKSGLLMEGQLGANINPLLREEAQINGTRAGWDVVFHPGQALLVVNIPIADQAFIQHVLNTNTGRWCTFSGINALCLMSTGSDMYHGTADGYVMRWSGNTDNGDPILLDAVLAPQHLNNRRQRKQLTALNIASTFPYPAYWSISTAVDYDVPPPRQLNIAPEKEPGEWGDAWDASAWGSASGIYVRGTRACSSDMGYAITVRLRLQARNAPIRWSGTQMIFNLGGLV